MQIYEVKKENDALSYFEYAIDNLEQKLELFFDLLDKFSKKIDDLTLFKFSLNPKEKESEKEKIQQFLDTLDNKIKDELNSILSEIDNLKQLLELLKRDYPIFYELFQCYFYSKEGLILKKTKIEDLIEKFENFINKAIALLEKYVNLSVDYLANDNLNFKELKKLIEKLKKVVGNELNHLFTIKTRLTQLKNAFSLIKFEELAFSKEALKSIKDLLGREGEVQKYLLSLIQNLLIEGNETRQIDVFNKINGIDIAKYPRGHKNLRLIIHYNYFKEGILFILDVVEHDKKYEQWHNEIKLDNYLKVGLKLTKVELAFSLYEKDCQKIIAKIITNHHLP